ncbi:transmembrane domain-containing protein [Cryptosporidium canis]|nr:transmembrane domain-containing protein [Cryptosporidium canis]
MLKSAQLRYENSDDQALKDESVSLNWNSWYFFPEHIINVSLLSVESFIQLDRGLSDLKVKDAIFKILEEFPSKVWSMPNTGSYSVTITREVDPGHYIFIILNGIYDSSSIQNLIEGGLVSKPIVVNQRPTKKQRIVLTYPKASRPFGFSEIINVNYKVFTEDRNTENQQNKVSIHIYSINPNDPSISEPKQSFETVGGEMSVFGLGMNECPAHYKVTVKMLQHPFHQDSSQYFWILPKSKLPLTLSNADLLSKRQLCIRQNNKYGMLPTPLELGILLVIVVINTIGMILLGLIINKLHRKRKQARKTTK